jgi:flagellar hook-associated protein 1 FlgK
MPDPFNGIETGLRALRTAQAGVDTASHNIANANTPGYSRQRVEYQVTDPYAPPSQWYRIGAMQIGTGVEARTITQARDQSLDAQLRQGYTARGALLARQSALKGVEDAVGEPGSFGINAGLTALFNAFQDLASAPESTALRSAAITGAASLAATFRQVAGRIGDVQNDLDGRVRAGVEEINNAASQIAALNREIRKVVAHGDQPNDLRDQRNTLFDTLSKKANTVLIPAADGTVTVQIGGVAVVRGGDAFPVADINALTADGDLAGGELKGLVDAQARVGAYRADLDALVQTFLAQANAQHQAGLDRNGNPGAALFTGAGAADIAVNAAIAADPQLLAAASVPTPPSTFAVGNGENALAMAGLATKKLSGGAFANDTLREFWGSRAAVLGVEVQAIGGAVRGQDAFVRQMEGRREAISGVSLDDEMADLVRFQRAYQAASKLISISDQMTETLINTFGR